MLLRIFYLLFHRIIDVCTNAQNFGRVSDYSQTFSFSEPLTAFISYSRSLAYLRVYTTSVNIVVGFILSIVEEFFLIIKRENTVEITNLTYNRIRVKTIDFKYMIIFSFCKGKLNFPHASRRRRRN